MTFSKAFALLCMARVMHQMWIGMDAGWAVGGWAGVALFAVSTVVGVGLSALIWRFLVGKGDWS